MSTAPQLLHPRVRSHPSARLPSHTTLKTPSQTPKPTLIPLRTLTGPFVPPYLSVHPPQPCTDTHKRTHTSPSPLLARLPVPLPQLTTLPPLYSLARPSRPRLCTVPALAEPHTVPSPPRPHRLHPPPATARLPRPRLTHLPLPLPLPLPPPPPLRCPSPLFTSPSPSGGGGAAAAGPGAALRHSRQTEWRQGNSRGSLSALSRSRQTPQRSSKSNESGRFPTGPSTDSTARPDMAAAAPLQPPHRAADEPPPAARAGSASSSGSGQSAPAVLREGEGQNWD